MKLYANVWMHEVCNISLVVLGIATKVRRWMRAKDDKAKRGHAQRLGPVTIG